MEKYILGLGLLVLLTLWGFATPTPTESNEPMTVVNNSILVELFTSQGCSSCPPADKVLQKLDEEARLGTLPVIALSYHVDYWNRLGWKDPYSSAEFSQRQRTYAGKINDRGVYTPQIVVQGQSGHVGSREKEVREIIGAVSREENEINIIAAIEQKGEETILNYEWSGENTDVILNIALAETALENDVPRGENRGRQLSHTNVVRQLVTIESPEKSGNLIVPKEVFSQVENGKIVLFAQERNSWEVLGVLALNMKLP